MSNIEIKKLTFGYNHNLIFQNASINIDGTWHLGLIGRNGRGKTTLLKLLQGEIETDLTLTSHQNFVYFPHEIVEKQMLTERVLQSLINFEQWELERELNLLKVDSDVLWRPFEQLSGGEQTKCLLATLFLDKNNFPLIDEPTNHLDLHSRTSVANYLKNKSGFIVVSHDRDFLNEVTDHILAIERQQICLYQGNFAIYEAEKKRRDEFEQAENEKLHREMTRLRQTDAEKRDWAYQREHVRGATFADKKVAKKQMKRAKSIENRINKAISDQGKLLKNSEKITELEIAFISSYHKTLFSCENFSLQYEKPLFEPITFSLAQGEILALTGDNGSGKSSFIQFLRHSFKGSSNGKATLAQGIKVSTVRQVYDHQGDLKEFAEENQLDLELFFSNLRKLGLERDSFSQRIEDLSQGEQKKIELARSLSQKAHLYLWDEPINYLDVFNQKQIADLLKAVKPTMIIVEHDRQFINEVASRQLTFQKVNKKKRTLK